MHISEDILNELKAISPAVAAVPYVNVFSVDAEYFNGIEAELQARISADGFYASPNAFSVPEGYFENLSTNILYKIRTEENENVAEEIQALSPVIAGIGNKNIFTVPQGYFEGLNFTNEEKTPAKVVRMNPVRSVFKYAAAAVITGLLGISVINIVERDNRTTASDPFISASIMNEADKIVRTGSFETELKTVSDNDIEEYLAQNGQDVNAALVASSTDDETLLPEASDYLMDENTLDNFLKQNNLRN